MGGKDDDDVVITGADFTAVQVVASIAADVNSVAVGQAVTLDGTNSTGTINSFTGPRRVARRVVHKERTVHHLHPTASGSYSFNLTVTGTGNTSSDNIGFNVVPLRHTRGQRRSISSTWPRHRR
jgi:hypothetical protein